MNASNIPIHLGNGVFAGRIFYLSSGLFPLLIGAAIFYALAPWRSRRMKVDGESTGVRRRSLRFHVVSWMALLMLRPMVLHADESPAAIFEHARSAYQALNSYADTGTVIYEYSPTAHYEHTFSTEFNRKPRRFLLDFHRDTGDRIVITADPEAFRSWWKATGQVTEYPNPNNAGALMTSEFPTNNVSSKIPALLYGKANLPGAFLNFSPERDAGLEDCGDKKCHRLDGGTYDSYGGTGKKVNFRTLSVWIEAGTWLIRKVTEEAAATTGTLSRTTTTFVPRANPTLLDEVFKFTPPK